MGDDTNIELWLSDRSVWDFVTVTSFGKTEYRTIAFILTSSREGTVYIWYRVWRDEFTIYPCRLGRPLVWSETEPFVRRYNLRLLVQMHV